MPDCRISQGRARRIRHCRRQRLLSALVLAVPAALAAEQSHTLDTLVITGTRSERSVLDTPVRTEVVAAAELQRTHARTLKEGLENVPGLHLREIHGKPGFEVSLQGLS
ncbi:MAG: hypothetical protein LAT50_15835, partial [Ectothiorhodospiraceae bacterium]|nr:hypothetical protein [Ectothiorhodospiraceae bacterium]